MFLRYMSRLLGQSTSIIFLGFLPGNSTWWRQSVVHPQLRVQSLKLQEKISTIKVHHFFKLKKIKNQRAITFLCSERNKFWQFLSTAKWMKSDLVSNILSTAATLFIVSTSYFYLINKLIIFIRYKSLCSTQAVDMKIG